MIFYIYSKLKIKNKNAGEKFAIKDPYKVLPTLKTKIPKYQHIYTFLGTIKAENPKRASRRAKEQWPDAPFFDLLLKENVTDKASGAMTAPVWTKPNKQKKKRK